jgi:cytochrome P450
MDITEPTDVRAIFADPRFVPPPPEPAGPMGTMTWLRASVARFSTGATHARRRAMVEQDLSRLDPARLRELAAASSDPYFPVAVLAAELGISDVDKAVAAVRLVAAAYQGQGAPDEAVATLVSMLEPADPEVLANRIGILVQACDATAALISSVDPPVKATRRQALVDVLISGTVIPAGTIVVLDISAFPFGAGPRPCPGREHALALAAGVTESSQVSPGSQ